MKKQERLIGENPKIGIRPTIDGRLGGVRESLEEQTMQMAGMAKDLLEKGEKTLALRAYFLSTLSQLGQKKLITIKLFKTNRDYLNEVINKTHVFPMLSTPFSQNVKLFEYAWYGLHDVTSEILEKFINNLEIIKTNINENK